MAARLDCIGTTALIARIQTHPGVLLVFDNVESRDDLMPWLPGGNSHVLVTSRNPVWTGIATTVSVDVFARSESIALIVAALPLLATQDAGRLAETLGDLPLAISQAVNFLAETGIPFEAYMTAVDEHAAESLREGKPAGYPVPLAATVTEAAHRLRELDPAAAELLTLCAYLAPEPIPLDLFTVAGAPLPTAMSATTHSTFTLHRAAGRLIRLGLARTTPQGPQLHRLTQAILRDADPRPDDSATFVEQLLIAARPDDGTDPAHWPRWGRLFPHIFAREPATSANSTFRGLASSAVWYLLERGDARTALPLATELRDSWTQLFGSDDGSALRAAGLVAEAFRLLGNYEKAVELDEDVLIRQRLLFGDDHPDTLLAADNLVTDMYHTRELERARDLGEDTLSRRRRLFGDDDQETLRSAGSLANNLRDLGDLVRAREIEEDTLIRRRTILGENHPETFFAMLNLAVTLGALGEREKSRDLNQETLDLRREALGSDHPDTLHSASNLAYDFRALDDFTRARELDEDTLSRRLRVLGEGHPQTQLSARNLAEDLRALGES